MTFDRHAQHPYNYTQPYQEQQQQQQQQHHHQPPPQQQQQAYPPQDLQQQQQQQQQSYLGTPLPWPPSTGSGLVGADMSYGQAMSQPPPPVPGAPATALSLPLPPSSAAGAPGAIPPVITSSAGASAVAAPQPSSTTGASSTSGMQAQVKTDSDVQDPTKQYHPEWGVLREQDFHPLALKHQRDLENAFQNGKTIEDFYFWQANLGGYCMADMNQNIVVSSEGVFMLVRRMVEGAPHPGRKKKKRGMG
ncbi:hypothetical protein BDB00DRAFT_844825 [Zychaea mexicana]|uniref:uncharacterized protein n=1 Tax=Zychaea mexicana TaxID=64656 RepID=UPI0022FDE515|nr:uncharacterized protein BDB00DRAFT_844825 [Zychaea mexicana]KAI9489132.1 hypothetical protein BDB00DRAFT_844825 [Zychaea mexicana]